MQKFQYINETNIQLTKFKKKTLNEVALIYQVKT